MDRFEYKKGNDYLFAKLLTFLNGLTEGKTYIVEVKEYHEKRSLNANGYAWKLITGIGNALRMSKEEVYLDCLKNYGQSEVVSIKKYDIDDNEIDVSGFFKYYDVVGESTLNGKDFVHYKIYKGSSEYDTKEMSIFIDGIKQEANALGIQTMTPEEIARLCEEWQNFA